MLNSLNEISHFSKVQTYQLLWFTPLKHYKLENDPLEQH